MFEKLRFKKKTDPAPSSQQQQQQQHHQESNDPSTLSSNAAFESTSSPPPLIPFSSASSSSTTSPPVSYNNNYTHTYTAPPPVSASSVAPLPASSSGSSMANIHRSPSDSSNHNLHLKTSYTSINNHYNPYSANNAANASTNHMMAHESNNNNNNYKVPLDSSNDANVKVPVSDSSNRTASSHTYSSSSNNSNGSNYTNTSNGSNGLNRNASAGRDSDWRTGNNSNNNNNHAQHTQAPRTIAATKPTSGAFAAATVHSTGDFAASTTNYAHSSNTAGNNGMGQHGGAVPVSTTSSASPSRSSSTSNRGGAGVSTGGSFTPQSATPPMTPRMAYGVADAAFSPGQEPTHATNDTSARDRYSHPSAGPHYGHLTTPALHVQPQSSSSSAFANHNNNSNNTSLSPFGIDESVASAFVSSPVTYQPPGFQTFYTQDGAQQAGGTVTVGAGATDSSTADSLHRAKSILNAGRETLAQQLEYQNRQMEQFRENLEGLSLDSNGSQTSTPHPSNDSGSSYMNGAGGQPSFNANHPPLASAVAIAASLAGANGSSDGPRIHEDVHTASSDYQQRRPRDRTISEGDSEHGSRQDLANNTGLSAASLGGSAMFSPPPRTNTSLAASNLVTHDIRQTSQRSHIEDGPGPVVLIAIGKTGQGKSSLLNKIMGTSELKASASVRAVTKGIAERSGWGRFEDSRRVLVTVADTPGLADTEGDDEKNIPILKEYIRSVGTRLGINAFLLVFKIDSGVEMIITILTALNDIMKDFPNFWDNVVLVFTGCDYRRNVMPTKQLYHGEIQQQLEKYFMEDLRRPGPSSNRDRDDDSSSESGQPAGTGAGGAGTGEEEGPIPQIPMVFLSCAEAPCGFSLGERCDCKARTTFLNAGIKRLWYKVREKKRWVLDADDDDELSGHA